MDVSRVALPRIAGVGPGACGSRGAGGQRIALCTADGLGSAGSFTNHHRTLEDVMAKGQMRSNKEKKKPKQDKNKKKGAAAPSPFANMHSQSNPGGNPYGKKN
jgi:hypothetical protein